MRSYVFASPWNDADAVTSHRFGCITHIECGCDRCQRTVSPEPVSLMCTCWLVSNWIFAIDFNWWFCSFYKFLVDRLRNLPFLSRPFKYPNAKHILQFFDKKTIFGDFENLVRARIFMGEEIVQTTLKPSGVYGQIYIHLKFSANVSLTPNLSNLRW